MKTAAALIATSLTALVLTSAAPAQTGGATAPPAPAATTPAKPAAPAAPKAVAPKTHTVIGEVVSIDAAAKTLTVKHTVKGKSEDMTLGAGKKAAAELDMLKAGDHVRVAYAEVDGKPMASAIHKVVKK